ncbi:hypothetical protein EVAR_66380_1 [Eumeta japonica]|uniref:Uncharacterized protein n=1 Tax=Eumeta variegata TaxID=151549 RepID=A0A4C1ZGE9_EUMVA|nr:hypothetical protein EVAR_66380_1 [Eumeta japonica]
MAGYTIWPLRLIYKSAGGRRPPPRRPSWVKRASIGDNGERRPLSHFQIKLVSTLNSVIVSYEKIRHVYNFRKRATHGVRRHVAGQVLIRRRAEDSAGRVLNGAGALRRLSVGGGAPRPLRGLSPPPPRDGPPARIRGEAIYYLIEREKCPGDFIVRCSRVACVHSQTRCRTDADAAGPEMTGPCLSSLRREYCGTLARRNHRPPTPRAPRPPKAPRVFYTAGRDIGHRKGFPPPN